MAQTCTNCGIFHRGMCREGNPRRGRSRSPRGLLRYESNESAALPQFGLEDTDPRSLTHGDDTAGVEHEDWHYQDLSRKRRKLIHRGPVDAFHAPEFPLEPEPKPTRHGRDSEGEIIRSNPNIRPRRARRSPMRFVSVPDFKTVNLPALVLDAISKLSSSTAKNVKREENTRPASLVQPDRSNLKHTTTLVTAVFPTSPELPKKVATSIDGFTMAPFRDVTNTFTESQPAQRQVPGAKGASSVQFEEDLICLYPPVSKQYVGNDEEDLICLSTPPKINENGSRSEQPVFLRRARPEQPVFIRRAQPAQFMQAAPRSAPRELPVEDPYYTLGINPGATRDEIIKAHERRQQEVVIARESDRKSKGMRHKELAFDQSVQMLNTARRMLIGDQA